MESRKKKVTEYLGEILDGSWGAMELARELLLYNEICLEIFLNQEDCQSYQLKPFREGYEAVKMLGEYLNPDFKIDDE